MARGDFSNWKATLIISGVRSQDSFLIWPEEHVACGLLMDGIWRGGGREKKCIQERLENGFRPMLREL